MKILRLTLAFILALLPINSFAQATASFSPTALPTTMSVTTTTGRVVFPSYGPTLLVTNLGTNSAYLNFGNASVTATTGGYLLSGGCTMAFDVSGRNYIAAITASASTSLLVTTGTGLPTLPPTPCVNGGTGGSTVNQGLPNTTAGGAWYFLLPPAISTGYVQLTSLGSAAGFSVPALTTFCVVVPTGAPINYRTDGVNPTASVGEPLAINQPAAFRMSVTNLGAIRFIEQSASAKVNIDCYRDF